MKKLLTELIAAIIVGLIIYGIFNFTTLKKVANPSLEESKPVIQQVIPAATFEEKAVVKSTLKNASLKQKHPVKKNVASPVMEPTLETMEKEITDKEAIKILSKGSL